MFNTSEGMHWNARAAIRASTGRDPDRATEKFDKCLSPAPEMNETIIPETYRKSGATASDNSGDSTSHDEGQRVA